MENVNARLGNILANDWDKSQWIMSNPRTLDLNPKTDTISVKFEFEKYDKPVVEIIGEEIVVKLGKVNIGGIR